MSDLRPKENPRREPGFPNISTAQLAMYVGLASLTVFFGASLVAYFITRAQATAWRTADLPSLPLGLWVSTVLLALLSGAIHWSEARILKNDQTGLRKGLQLTLALAVAFLLAQVQNWRAVAQITLGEDAKTLYAFTFYSLTALHALHVLAGLGPLLYIIKRARNDQYSSSRSEGIKLLRQYWDFLSIVWVILLLSLWFS